ncbi:protoporphyrinogen/coproporphyrinogen oxidase [Verrucomicrobiota bacterium]
MGSLERLPYGEGGEALRRGQSMRYVIIGAGPAGLGAALTLEKRGEPWRLFESESYPGGISASFEEDGFTWDLGGHVLFSHYDCFDRMLEGITGDGDWYVHQRRAYVRILGRWVPYPFQNNIRYLPGPERDECLAGLREAASEATDCRPANFEEWIRMVVGDGIARLFMLPYNGKVWACEPRRMSTHWLGERVAVPDLSKVLESPAEEETPDDWGPNKTFRFPVHGGTGSIWRRLAGSLPSGNTLYGHEVVRVDRTKKAVLSRNGHTEGYDCLISTIPLDRLAALADIPQRGLVRGLRHNSVHVAGVGVRGSLPDHARTKTWLYFPESGVPFYRVTVFSNYSGFNAPEGCYSLMAEVATPSDLELPAENVVSACVEGLRQSELIHPEDEVVHTWHRRIPYAYPIPTLDRDDILGGVLPLLEEDGIYSRGRFGAWKYEVGNMDHCFAQGVEIADRLAAGAEELTIHQPDVVNAPRSQ